MAKAPKVSPAQHAAIEKKETPNYEAREHSPNFLRKAERLAERKPKARRSGR